MHEFEEERAYMEMESRVKNLVWTVGEDYKLQPRMELRFWKEAPEIVLYDGIKQGCFSRNFDKDFFSMYLVKKIYCGAQEKELTGIAQICVEASCARLLEKMRPGVSEIRKTAMENILEYEFSSLNQTKSGQLQIYRTKEILQGVKPQTSSLTNVLRQIRDLENAADTMQLVRTVDAIYNSWVDPRFEKNHGGLYAVLNVTLEELEEFPWQDYLDEEAKAQLLEKYAEKIAQDAINYQADVPTKEETVSGKEKTMRVLTQEDLDKMERYMELNFGTSYLPRKEQQRRNRLLCKDAHGGCSLYYTDGILENPVRINAQYVNAKKQSDHNLSNWRNHRSVARQNIEELTRTLRSALVFRLQSESRDADYGRIVPSRLWKVGRTDTGKLFVDRQKQSSTEFVVEVLLDASGSQRQRQSQVALQAYIISEALSNAQIPHRVQSFCTFWDYTVLQRFREYEDDRTENRNIFRYTTSSNNRDGLAVRAVGYELLQRPEENRILIVLSDGRPNDVTVNRPNSRNPNPYSGEYAIHDTAAEIRKLRNQGVFVLGVFTGKEQDFLAEKKIFGKDFAYIKNLDGFSRIAGQYLKKILSDVE